MSSPTPEEDVDAEEEELGSGDSLAERIEAVDLKEDETVSTDEMRDRLGL